MDFFSTIHLYIYLIATVLAIYSVGFILQLIVKQKILLFNKMVIGAIAIPTIYAVVKTSGISIFSINIILVIWFLYQKRQEYNLFDSKDNFRNLFFIDKGLLPLLIASSLFFVFQLNLMFDIETGKGIALNHDYSYYSRIASYLRDFGVENRNVEYFLSEKGGVTIYHYFELWWAALLSKLYGIHTQFSLNLITYPLLYTITYAGVVALLKYIKLRLNKKESWTDYILSYFFFTTSMVGLLYPSSISFLAMDVWTPSVLSMPKLIVIYIFIILMFLSLFEKKYHELSLSTCLIAVSYTPVFLPLFSGVGLYYIIAYYKKRNNLNDSIKYLFPIILTTLLFGILYLFFGGTDSVSPSFTSIIKHFSSSLAIITFINILGKTSIQIIITGFPFLVLAFLLRKHYMKVNGFYLLIILLIISGLFFYGFFNQMHDAVQLWANLYIPLANTFGFFIIVSALYLYKENIIYSFLGIAIIIANVYQHNPLRKSNERYLDDFFNSHLTTEETPKFVYIKEKGDYSTYFSKFEQVYAGATVTLMRQYDPLIISCISNQNIDRGNHKINLFQKNTTFIRYVNILKEKGVFIDYKNAQLQFVKEKGIDFILTYKKRPLPVHLREVFYIKAFGEIDGYTLYKIKETKNE